MDFDTRLSFNALISIVLNIYLMQSSVAFSYKNVDCKSDL